MIHGTLKNLPTEDICIHLSIDNHAKQYLCECGSASLLGKKDCLNLAAIFISHTHIDHFVNFDTVLRHQLGSGMRVTLCGPKGIAKQLQAKFRAYNWNLIAENELQYEIREILNERRIKIYQVSPPKWNLQLIGELDGPILYQNEAVEVKFTILDHGTPSIAYSFKEPNAVNFQQDEAPFAPGPWVKMAKAAFLANSPATPINIQGQDYSAGELFPYFRLKTGYHLGVAMDHLASAANHDKIINTFQNADQVFIETYYLDEDKALALQNRHSYAKASAEVMRRAGVKNATPVHFSRRYTEEDIQLIQQQFKAAL
jgi:ribonuclease Z